MYCRSKNFSEYIKPALASLFKLQINPPPVIGGVIEYVCYFGFLHVVYFEYSDYLNIIRYRQFYLKV
jgi:hypothetical protein